MIVFFNKNFGDKVKKNGQSLLINKYTFFKEYIIFNKNFSF